MRDRWGTPGGKTVTDTETPESSMAYPEAMAWPETG